MMVFIFFVVLIGVFLIPSPSSDDIYEAHKKRNKERREMLEKLNPDERKKEETKEKKLDDKIGCFMYFIIFLILSGVLVQCSDYNSTLNKEHEEEMRLERTRR